jgi:hypothetical protein
MACAFACPNHGDAKLVFVSTLVWTAPSWHRPANHLRGEFAGIGEAFHQVVRIDEIDRRILERKASIECCGAEGDASITECCDAERMVAELVHSDESRIRALVALSEQAKVIASPAAEVDRKPAGRERRQIEQPLQVGAAVCW